jgi:hypothetical protein
MKRHSGHVTAGPHSAIYIDVRHRMMIFTVSIIVHTSGIHCVRSKLIDSFVMILPELIVSELLRLMMPSAHRLCVNTNNFIVKLLSGSETLTDIK